MIEIKEKTIKSYLICPNCGGVHEFDRKRSVGKLVCLLCDEVIDTGLFEPCAVTYSKKNSDLNSFLQ